MAKTDKEIGYKTQMHILSLIVYILDNNPTQETIKSMYNKVLSHNQWFIKGMNDKDIESLQSTDETLKGYNKTILHKQIWQIATAIIDFQ